MIFLSEGRQIAGGRLWGARAFAAIAVISGGSEVGGLAGLAGAAAGAAVVYWLLLRVLSTPA